VTSDAPHWPQNLFPGGFTLPHAGHAASSRAPHSPQNFTPTEFSCWQRGQFMRNFSGLSHLTKTTGWSGIGYGSLYPRANGICKGTIWMLLSKRGVRSFNRRKAATSKINGVFAAKMVASAFDRVRLKWLFGNLFGFVALDEPSRV
jgi:hypothetical protein